MSTNEPLIFLPGMMCDARIFLPQIESLSSNYAVMVHPMTAGSSVNDIAQMVLQHSPPSFTLAGLSMGGIVAMEIMRLAPERVSRLALLDTNHLAEAPERKQLREPQIAKVAKGQLASVMIEEMKPNYLSEGPDKQAILDLCMQMANALGAEVFIRQSRALQTRIDQTQTLAAVQVPTLVLCGENDVLCPVSTHRTICQLVTGATLSVIPGAGHLPTLEQPDATTEVILTWLNS